MARKIRKRTFCFLCVGPPLSPCEGIKRREWLQGGQNINRKQEETGEEYAVPFPRGWKQTVGAVNEAIVESLGRVGKSLNPHSD